jgi:hypothetical protein
VVCNSKAQWVKKLEVTSTQWKEVQELEATLSSAALLTAVSQHERAWTGAFYPIVARRLINQCSPGSLSPCIPLGGDTTKIKRVEMRIETAVGKPVA